MIFLVVYDVSKRELVRLDEFSDGDRELARRRCKDEQDSLWGQLNNVEVALFEAASRAELKRTHSRYFEDVAQLGNDLDTALIEGQQQISKRLNSV